MEHDEVLFNKMQKNEVKRYKTLEATYCITTEEIKKQLERIILNYYNFFEFGKLDIAYINTLEKCKALCWRIHMYLAKERVNEICEEYGIGKRKTKKSLVEKIKNWFKKNKQAVFGMKSSMCDRIIGGSALKCQQKCIYV